MSEGPQLGRLSWVAGFRAKDMCGWLLEPQVSNLRADQRYRTLHTIAVRAQSFPNLL